mmetsp:Transcript_121226/g.387310  ORF Transcript_121226/g.387310 Transcript_121226/m.387310 type:complete len:261 (+) Transcript_121226:755-1537(+)
MRLCQPRLDLRARHTLHEVPLPVPLGQGVAVEDAHLRAVQGHLPRHNVAVELVLRVPDDPNLLGVFHAAVQYADVANDSIASILARANASAAWRDIHPGHRLRLISPVRDAQAHAMRHDLGQRGQVLLVARGVLHDNKPAILPQRGPHPCEEPVVHEELGLNVEGVPSVDREAGTRAVGIRMLPGVLFTAAPVAHAELLIDGGLAPVQGRLERMVVGLHDVDFRAPLAANHVRVAIVWRLAASVCACAGEALRAHCGHRD